jgi:hypothetical protein
VPPDTPCGCGSGRPFGGCCLQDGGITKRPLVFWPRPPQTGRSVRKCFLRDLRDCGGGKSGDHVVSRTVLAEFSPNRGLLQTARISGDFSLDSDVLKTNSLCRRHNSAFSPLDNEAARFVRAIKSIQISLNTGTKYQANRWFHFQGRDLENWLIKTAVNAFRSGWAGVSEPEYTLHPDIWKLLFMGRWPPQAGFYLNVNIMQTHIPVFYSEIKFSMALIHFGKTVYGAKMTLFGLPIVILLRSGYYYGVPLSHCVGVWRPEKVVIFRGQQVHVMTFSWVEQSSKATVVLSHGDAAAPLPRGDIVYQR